MAVDKKRKLEMTVAALQDRWGVRAVRRLQQDQLLAVPHIPTGFPTLDEALVIGGLPRGRISEIIGIPSSGMATIALKIVANAQERAGTAIYIDPDRTFDPDYAVRCGLELSQLVLIHPDDTRQALAILGDFVLGGGISILVFDLPFSQQIGSGPAQALATTLGRLIAPLSQTECALLFLTSLPASPSSKSSSSNPGPNSAGDKPSLADYPWANLRLSASLPHYTAVRLFIQRERWIYKQRDINGYQARVLVVKNKLGSAGRRASITITFNQIDEP